ncbi:conserved hypothetical protein, partial [Ricinus communis]
MRAACPRGNPACSALPGTVEARVGVDPAAFRAGTVVEADATLAEALHEPAQHFLGQARNADVRRLARHVQRLARGRHALLDQAVVGGGGAVAGQDLQRTVEAIARDERLGRPQRFDQLRVDGDRRFPVHVAQQMA